MFFLEGRVDSKTKNNKRRRRILFSYAWFLDVLSILFLYGTHIWSRFQRIFLCFIEGYVTFLFYFLYALVLVIPSCHHHTQNLLEPRRETTQPAIFNPRMWISNDDVVSCDKYGNDSSNTICQWLKNNWSPRLIFGILNAPTLWVPKLHGIWRPSWSFGQANLSKAGELDYYHFRHSNPHMFEQVCVIWIQYMRYFSLGWHIFPWVLNKPHRLGRNRPVKGLWLWRRPSFWAKSNRSRAFNPPKDGLVWNEGFFCVKKMVK